MLKEKLYQHFDRLHGIVSTFLLMFEQQQKFD